MQQEQAVVFCIVTLKATLIKNYNVLEMYTFSTQNKKETPKAKRMCLFLPLHHL